MIRNLLFFRRRAFAAFLLLSYLHTLSLAATTVAKKPHNAKSLAEQINQILAEPELARAHWGIDVIDQQSGKVIYSLNQDQLFVPASNAKLFTTAAALALAGPD